MDASAHNQHRWNTPEFEAFESQILQLGRFNAPMAPPQPAPPDLEDDPADRVDDTINTQAALGSPVLSSPVLTPREMRPRPMLRMPPRTAPQVMHSGTHSLQLEQTLKEKQSEIESLREEIRRQHSAFDKERREYRETADRDTTDRQKRELELQRTVDTTRGELLNFKETSALTEQRLRSQLKETTANYSLTKTALESEQERSSKLANENQKLKAVELTLESQLASLNKDNQLVKEQLGIASQDLESATKEAEQLKGLKKELARRYQNLSQEKSILEEQLRDLADLSEAEKQRLETQLDAKSGELKQIKDEHERDVLACEQLKKDVKDLEKQLSTARCTNTQLEEDLSKVKGDLAQQCLKNGDNPLVKEAQEQVRAAEKRASGSEALLNECKQQLAATENKLAELQTRFTAETGAPLAQRLRAQIEELAGQLRRARDSNTQIEVTAEGYRQEMRLLEDNIGTLNDKLEKLQKQLEQIRPDSKKLRLVLNDYNQLQSNYNKLYSEYQLELDRIRADCDATITAERKAAETERQAINQHYEQRLAQVSSEAAASLSKSLTEQQELLQQQLNTQLAQVESLSNKRVEQIESTAELQAQAYKNTLEEQFQQQLEKEQHKLDMAWKSQYSMAMRALEIAFVYHSCVDRRQKRVLADMICIKDIALRCLLQVAEDHNRKMARLRWEMGSDGEPKRTLAAVFIAALASVRMRRLILPQNTLKIPQKLENEYRMLSN